MKEFDPGQQMDDSPQNGNDLAERAKSCYDDASDPGEELRDLKPRSALYTHLYRSRGAVAFLTKSMLPLGLRSTLIVAPSPNSPARILAERGLTMRF